MLITDMKEPRPGAENNGEKANIRRLERTWEELNQGEQRKRQKKLRRNFTKLESIGLKIP